VLQQMRSLAKYVWYFVALAFVGGFLLYETSGLTGMTTVTPTTSVAVINGQSIRYVDFRARVDQEVQAQQQRNQGRMLSEDDSRRIENEVFDAIVMDVVLEQEFARRGITVTDDEIRDLANQEPHPQLANDPQVMTNGRFDPAKYARLLGSSTARQMGILAGLESYYRSEIPRRKLFDQVAGGIYVPDADLWRSWRDERDSAQVTFVAFRPGADTAAHKAVSDAEAQAYFNTHRDEYKRPGRAVLSVLVIPKVIGAADSAAARDRAARLRAEAMGSAAKFSEVAKRESSDSVSAAEGGSLPKSGRGRYVAEFEKAAWALAVGEVSAPVLSPYGYHLIRVDERKGDSITLRHILVPINASDSAMAIIDRMADTLARRAAQAEDWKTFDDAAAEMRLTPSRVIAIENDPAYAGPRLVPGASAWAFGGAKIGETSSLLDDDNGYYLARLDSLQDGGEQEFSAVKDDIKRTLATRKQIDALLPTAQTFATAAAAGLEAAAAARQLKTETTTMFTRTSVVSGLGQYDEAVGAAFGLPIGKVSQPVKTNTGVFVLRVDKRVNADSTAWAAQKGLQRQQRMQALRSATVQQFLEDLRDAATVDDRRKKINAAIRRQG
jgi:peptidyl-prolyl cis-trans isomerase D